MYAYFLVNPFSLSCPSLVLAPSLFLNQVTLPWLMAPPLALFFAEVTAYVSGHGING